MITLNTNLDTLYATHQLDLQRARMNTPVERISSGLRINKAGDDAAGLSISNRLQASKRGLSQAVRNANDAISFTQTAEGALGGVSNLLQRLRELSVQSSSELYSDGQRGQLQLEAAQLIGEIDQIGQTSYNKQGLFGGQYRFHVGAGAEVQAGLHFVSQRLSSERLGAHSNYSSLQGVDTTQGLAYGDLTVITREGLEVRVRATSERDDQLSTVARGASAISKAAAINDGTEHHGVSATAGPTTLTSTGIGAQTTLGSGDSLSINGVQLSGFTVQMGDADGSFVREINAVSELTGVTASRNDEGLVELSAEDGRNIAIQAQGAGASLGFVDGAIQGGQLTLSSTKSYSLRFASSDVNDQGLGGIARSTTSGGGAGSPSLNSSIISGGEVVFSSPPGPATPVSYAQDNSRFNASAEISSITGAYVSGGGFANPQDFYGYFRNGKMFITPDNAGTPNFGAAQQSNGISGSNSFTINGASFTINYATANIDSNSGGDQRVSAFKFRLSEATTVGGGAVEALMSKRLDQNHVASIDISSARGARRAMGIIDVALEEVNYYRGQLGATQNRLSSMVNNFEQARFDLSAAHSRINDADFAQELSSLSSSQVIQQAGVSVISQANASFATALNLLSTGVESAERSALYS